MTPPDSLTFTPVPLKSRHDGWAPDLQVAFIVALARDGSVSGAARAVGKTRATAYALRGRPGAASFAAAWDAALLQARRARRIVVRSVRTPAPYSRSERLSPLDGGRPLSADRLFAGLDRYAPKSDEADKADTSCATP